MILAAMQPVPPAIDRYSDKNELQPRISIQRRPVEEDNTQNLIGNGCRPVPDILFHQQPDADRARNKDKKLCRTNPENFEEMHLLGLAIFACFVHVADSRLVKQQVGSAVTAQLDAIPVIPLDQTLHMLAVSQHDHDRSLALHLLLIVEVFGVSLVLRLDLLHQWHTVSTFQPLTALRHWLCARCRRAERRPDELAIDEFFLTMLRGLACSG